MKVAACMMLNKREIDKPCLKLDFDIAWEKDILQIDDIRLLE